eukprot:jgi/Chrzof1/7319/Cz02g19080.t1
MSMPEQAFAFVAGDTKPVSIGRNTNLQDGVFVGTLNPAGQDTKVGSNVSVGHGAVLQGCTVEDNTLIGMNAILQAGSKVESGSMVAAGAVVQPDTIVPTGELWGGNPARRLRDLKPEEKRYLNHLPDRYAELAKKHRDMLQYVEKEINLYTQS